MSELQLSYVDGICCKLYRSCDNKNKASGKTEVMAFQDRKIYTRRKLVAETS